jgi:hypothetical protein
VSARFAVEQVFDLPSRGLTLAVGRMLDGVVAPPMTLQVEGTTSLVTIAGIDLIPPPPDAPNRVSLVVSPDSPTRPTPGMVLISP